jgi:hypothetical protein
MYFDLDHIRKKNCRNNIWCIYNLGEYKEVVIHLQRSDLISICIINTLYCVYRAYGRMKNVI